MVSEYEKRALEENYAKPYEEIVAEARRNLEELNLSQHNIEFVLKYDIYSALNADTLKSAKKIYEEAGEQTAVVFLTTD